MQNVPQRLERLKRGRPFAAHMSNTQRDCASSATYSGSEGENAVAVMGVAIPPPSCLTVYDIQENCAEAAPVPVPAVVPQAPVPAAIGHGHRGIHVTCQFCWRRIFGGPTALSLHQAESKFCRYRRGRMEREEPVADDAADVVVKDKHSRPDGSVPAIAVGREAPPPKTRPPSQAVGSAAADHPRQAGAVGPRQRLGQYLRGRKESGEKKRKRRKGLSGEDSPQRERAGRGLNPPSSPGGGGAPSLRVERLGAKKLRIQVI